MWIIHDLSCSKGWARAFTLSLCIAHSPFSSPHLSSGQIFIRPAQCLTWQGSMDITCRGCSEATGFAWWGQILSHGPSSTLTAPIKCKTGIVADENVYLTAHVYPLSLSLLFLFSLGCFDVVVESWKIKERFILPCKSSIPVTIGRETGTSMTVFGSVFGKVDCWSEREKQKERP